MPLIIREMRLLLEEDESLLLQKAANMLCVNKDEIQNLRIVRQSIDARDKNDIHFKYTLAVSFKDAADEIRLAQKQAVNYEEEEQQSPLIQGSKPLALRPVIAGAGPAGLFCALLLSEYGYAPLLIERGRDTDRRMQDFAALCQKGILDHESNVCFGEGGAGAFSDGKLTTRIKDKRANIVLERLLKAGAPKDILYSAKPHMGTENIRAAVKNIRNEIIANGGDVLFGTKLNGLILEGGGLRGVTIANKGTEEKIKTELLVLATGHSARDTYAMLQQSGIAMQKKPFAMGLRIEHPREFIDRSQYGRFFDHPRLGAAEYALTTRYENRGVYTFCMCPGGEVINASTEDKMTTVNGMSYYSRAQQNSNSAIVVTIGTDDLAEGALSGVDFQRKWERLCFDISHGAGAPAQRAEDFIAGRVSKSFGAVLPSVKPYAEAANLNACLPEFVAQGIKKGLQDFSRRIKGFDMPDAVLTGVETRTSSPVTILRDESYEALGFAGIYPCGEGAGHAGGIVSAAVDGIKIAQAIIQRYKPGF